jgi:hypothetical protein
LFRHKTRRNGSQGQDYIGPQCNKLCCRRSEVVHAAAWYIAKFEAKIFSFGPACFPQSGNKSGKIPSPTRIAFGKQR